MELLASVHRATEMREAGDRSRTGDLQLGKLTLYQLSYARTALWMGREGLEPPTSAM